MSAATWAVIVNWNGGEANLDCIRSILVQGLPESQIIFVDNASTDGSMEAVAAARPGVQILRNKRNVGFGYGANRGIEHALERGAERVLLVNNDAVLYEGMLELLHDELDHESDVGIVGPRICLRAEPDIVWAAGGAITFRQNISTLIGFREPDGPEFHNTYDVDFVTGCVMLVRREVFEEAGLLEGAYFAYHEDVEFGIAASEAGFRSRIVGKALALHDAHSSTGGGYNPRRKYMMGVNTVWFLRRHGSPARWLSFAVYDVATLPFAWLTHALRGEGQAVRAKARGIWDGLRGLRVSEESLRAWSLR
ncbi:MAG: glycosyltransferase family 2 protein [Planctomycetota bacterium]